MRKLMSVLPLFLLALVMVSCGGNGNGKKSGNKKSLLMPTSSGRPYEIIVVVDQDMWERPAGRALYNVLDTDVPGLPQSERSFRIMFTSPQNYDATLKLIRNIIVVDVNKDMYTQPKFKYAKDVYSSPQSILTIQAPDEQSFGLFVEENTQVIIDFFTHAEMNRQIYMLEEKHNQAASSAVREMFGCDVWISGELASTKKGKDFYWAGTNTATGDQNFVIYSFPYRDQNTFTKEYLVHKRDSVMQINIPGSQEGRYMMTDSLMTDVKAIAVQGEYCMEMRGLWRVKGDLMGGPYVSHARLDKKNQRIIVSEIFIYSPDKMKRNLVRTMEASLYTVRLPEALEKEAAAAEAGEDGEGKTTVEIPVN